MKLLLKDDVEGLGFCGDEVTVRDGYGRNYLVPQGKAILANPKNLKQFNHQKMIVQGKVKKIVNAATALAEQISKVTCIIKKKVGEQGKLFGSVTNQEIAEFLRKNGIEVDKRKIHPAEPIRTLGDFVVPLKLHTEVTAEIKVSVIPDKEPAKEAAAVPEEAKQEEQTEEA
ncbi:MAG: 50S ribosomal protein L9 [Nitrospinae bacterium]|jgi:large subunit ribosomal protein L9|nr:50S ribosomal protein L9 [Nitrospinota bacterium]MDA1109000.1 50S ribosomal protein L9 [Nitrospinota bacterium]